MSIKMLKQMLPEIEEIIRLVNDLNIAREQVRRKYADEDGRIPKEKEREYYFDKGAVEYRERVIDYFERFSHSQVTLIRALMYIGRDVGAPYSVVEDGESYDEYDESFNSNDEQQAEEEAEEFDPDSIIETFYNDLVDERADHAILHMLEKAPMAEYLERGITLLQLRD